MNNKLLIISGYTSSGKNTVVEKLIKKYKFKNIYKIKKGALFVDNFIFNFIFHNS